MSDDRRFEHTGREIRDEIRIDAPAETVYRAWADPEVISSWFVKRMAGRAEEGETIEWFWDEESGPGVTHEVVLAEAPHHLVTRMALPHGASYLEITIEQEEGYSVVRLVQSGFGEGPEWDEQYEAMLSGWLVAMAVLKFFVERYLGRERREVVVLTDADFDREFRGQGWGSKVGVRLSSWMEDLADLTDLEGLLTKAVERLVGSLGG